MGIDENNKPIISIVIPIYNRPNLIAPGLDSIFSQKLNPEDVEVLAVNNGAVDPKVQQTLDEYTYNGIRPQNLRIINVKENRRGGSGRNAGIRAATGSFIIHRDHDDVFAPGALSRLIDELKATPDIDMLIYDREIYLYRNKKMLLGIGHANNSTEIMTGDEYLSTQLQPVYLWTAAYRRDYLLLNNLFVTENAIFEDVDYINLCVMLARKVRYIPVAVVYYYQYSDGANGNQVSQVNYATMTSGFEMGERFRVNSQRYKSEHPKGVAVLDGLATYYCRQLIRNSLWKLPYKEIVELLVKYPQPIDENIPKLSKFATTKPKLYATAAKVLGPLYGALIRLYRKIKHLE